jgi:hypothetical protein
MPSMQQGLVCPSDAYTMLHRTSHGIARRRRSVQSCLERSCSQDGRHRCSSLDRASLGRAIVAAAVAKITDSERHGEKQHVRCTCCMSGWRDGQMNARTSFINCTHADMHVHVECLALLLDDVHRRCVAHDRLIFLSKHNLIA